MTGEFPTWAAEEISKASWGEADPHSGTGYFLEIDSKSRRADIMFYDPLPEGRYIATADIPQGIQIDGLKTGEVYAFKLKTFRATLSDKLKEYLLNQYQIKMEHIYKYELTSAEILESEGTTTAGSSEDEDLEE